MRLTTVILLATLMQVSAATFGQRITINENRITLKAAFKEIRKQSGYDFYYEGGLISNSEWKAVKLHNATVEEALKAILKDLPYAYIIGDKNITIKKAEEISSNRADLRAVDVKGRVVDETNQPLPGATIAVKGKNRQVITDKDGNFILPNVSENDVLVVSYLGYQSLEVTPSANMGAIKLSPSSASNLDQVVVVGYGTMRKKDLTGSVTQIIPDKIANENPKTVQDILRGTPGVRIGYDPSAKGGGSIDIRGRRSVFSDGGHNNPLLVLDGIIFNGELSEINPDDIGQIDILKDASAAAIYGARAANGVIIISTKRGKIGKPVINMTANTGATEVSNFRERFDPESYMQHRQDWYTKNTYGTNPTTGAYEAYQTGVYTNRPGFFLRPDQLGNVSLANWRAYTTNQAGESDLSIWAKRLGVNGNALKNFLDGKIVDWTDETFRVGLNQDYNASVSGASDKVNYYFSMGYLDNKGAVVSDAYKAIRSNLKLNANVTNWLEIGANVNFQDRTDGNLDIDMDQQMRNSPFADITDAAGNLVQFPLSAEYSQRGYNYDYLKQFLALEKGYTVFNTILNAKVKLPFNITYSFNYAPRLQFFYDRYFASALLPGSDPATRGVNRESQKNFNWNLNNTLAWEQTFLDKHRVNVTLVQEAERSQSWRDRLEARKILPTDDLGFHYTKGATKENSTFFTDDATQSADGLLGRFFYSYDDKYMLTASVRRDGYSAFGSSNPYAYFPSIGLAWTFSNEKFFSKISNVMNYGKLRATWGKNGNRELGNPYLALANLSGGAGRTHGYLVTSSGALAQYQYLYQDRLASPELQWEKTESWNLALDFGLLKDRVTGSLEYYSSKTNDMIMLRSLPSFTGFTNIATNLGQVDNRGIDITVNTTNIKKDNFQWNTTFGMSYNKNMIKHIYYKYSNVLDAQGNVTGTREDDDIPNGWFIGQPIGVIWNYRVTGIWQANEAAEAAKYGQLPGDPKVANNHTDDDIINADGSRKAVYNDKDKEFLGGTVPPFSWSLRNDFTLWKNLNISFNIYAYSGHKSLNGNYLNNDDDGGRMQFALINLPKKEYWTPENPTNKYGRIEARGPVGAEGAQMLYDRSFLRLDNISVAYTIPKKWTSQWQLSNVRVFGTVRNVGTLSNNWEFGDPETGSWASRVYNLGLNLVF